MKLPSIPFLRRLAPKYGPHYGVAAQGMLRGLGLIYVLSFWSLAAQIMALSGSRGLMPASALMNYFKSQSGPLAPLFFPSVLWLTDHPVMLLVLSGVGAIAGLTLLYGFYPWFSALICWVSWVSLLQVCQPWMSSQGDYLMAEIGLWVLLLISPLIRTYPSPSEMGSRITGIIVINFILFKVLFSSGLAKLNLGSDFWASSTAYYYFFETQPLPTSIAWYAHYLPHTVLEYAVWGTMFIELIMPFYLFLPRTFRNLLAGAVSLQSLFILLVGQHGFLPYLLLLLSFSLIDDVSWRKILPVTWGPPAAISLYQPQIFSVLILALVLPVTIWQIYFQKPESILPPWHQVESVLARVHSSNRYALYPEVPAQRKEFAIQGSIDGKQWVEYRFKLKPTDPASLPSISALHLPRLDEQFTRLANRIELDSPQKPPIWLYHLIGNLLQSDPATLSLFPVDPFPGKTPEFIRLALYEYRFADPVVRREQNIWWVREFKGFYGPVFTKATTPELIPVSPFQQPAVSP